VVVTLTLGMNTHPPDLRTFYWTAEATPVVTLRIGDGQTMEEALWACVQAIVAADEVPE
jgi:hypothetical protein